MKKHTSFVAAVIVSLCFLFGLASCGEAQSGETISTETNSGTIYHTSDSTEGGTEAKVVYTAKYTIYDNHFEEVVKNVNQEVNEVKGYIFESEQTLEYAYYVYKVPSANLNAFFSYMDNVASVTNKNITSQDVTSQYNEIESQIETLESRRDAYLKYEQETSLNMTQIMQIDEKIDELNAQIKALYTTKAQMESATNYSQVTVNYYLSSESADALYWSNYFAFLIGAGKIVGTTLLYSLPFALIAGMIILILLLIRKHKKVQ